MNANAEALPEEQELFNVLMDTVDFAWRNELTKNEIEAWLENFVGKVHEVRYERQLALWILSNFVYYNEKEVRNLSGLIFRQFIHNVALGEYGSEEDIDDEMIRSFMKDTRIAFIGRAGESGAFVMYYFRNENQLPVELFLVDNVVPKSVRILAFVDDVTITGTQARRYLKNFTVRPDLKKYVLTFIGTKEATELLKKNGFELISCMTVGERDQCFSGESMVFRDYSQHLMPCKQMAYEYGKIVFPKQPLGFDDGGYLFGFFYNTPDNTLPILWSQLGGWTPVLRRYHKFYRGDYEHGTGTFI